MINKLELKSDIIFFTGHGFTWEYPGFFLMQFGDYEITVGYDNSPKKYCLQVSTNNGACCEGYDGDYDTRDEVLTNVVLTKDVLAMRSSVATRARRKRGAL